MDANAPAIITARAKAGQISPLAGKSVPAAMLIDVTKLLDAYTDIRPDPAIPAQRISFGTSGHRGVSLSASFNEWHVLAITQAICDYRKSCGIDGPLYLGIDTHALSLPASYSALEVLAANGVRTALAARDEFTPTPVVSHAILAYNRAKVAGLADGIVITPSHNPPEFGGFKYNATDGGPADTQVTDWIGARANALLESRLHGVLRMPLEQARRESKPHEHDFREAYVRDLHSVIDLEAIRRAGIRMAVDPLGGAGVHYWARIAEHYRLDLNIVSEQVDPTFRFMTLDWDGRIRMDPSSSWAMQRLIGLKDHYDVAFACDTDHDRHGIVTRLAGLLPANHYLCVAIDYLFRNRPDWNQNMEIGKTVVSSALIDRIGAKLGRPVYEVPVGFKWFVSGLLAGRLGFCGEESAGASFSRLDGSVWTTDKDGIVAALLSAEITARAGDDPGERYADLSAELGAPCGRRIEAPITANQKERFNALDPGKLQVTELAGSAVKNIINRAPGDNAPIGGIKVATSNGWFAARPSGTEDVYRIYAESFVDEAHLALILTEAEGIIDAAVGAA